MRLASFVVSAAITAGMLCLSVPGVYAQQTSLELQKRIGKAAAAQLLEARQHLQWGDVAGADKLFRQAIARAPKNAELVYQIGLIYLRFNYFDQGLQFIRESVRHSPRSALLPMKSFQLYEQIGNLFSEGERLKKAGNPAAAADRYRTILRLDPKNGEAFYRIAELYHLGKRRKEALRYTGRALRAAPGNVPLRLKVTQLYQALGKRDIAEREYRAIVERGGASRVAKEAQMLLSGLFKDQVEEAKQRIRDGSLEPAMTALREILAHDPRNVEALYHVGVILLRQNRYQDGVKYIRSSVEADPSNTRIRLILANVYADGGAFEDAEAQYRKLMEMDAKEAPEAEIRLGLMLSKHDVEQGEPDKAVERLEMIQHKYPDDARILEHLGVVWMAKKDYRQAEKIYRKLLVRSPDNLTAHSNMALIYESRGDIEQQKFHLRRIIDLAPDSKAAMGAVIALSFLEGEKMVEGKDLQGALKRYQDVLSVDPDNSLAYFNIGAVYHQMGKLPEAEKAYHKVIELDPANLEVRLRLGRLYAESERLDEAIKEFETVQRQGGGRPEAQRAREVLVGFYEILGDRAFRERKLSISLMQYRKALEIDNDNASLHRKLARIYQAQGNLPAAQSEFEQVVRIAPNDISGYLELAANLEQMNRLDEAQRVYAKAIALETDPRKADQIVDELRLVNTKRLLIEDRLDEAQQELADLIEKVPDNATAWYYKGLILGQKGDLEAAVDAYRRVIGINSNHFNARLNLAVLYERLNREDSAFREYRYIVQRSRGKVAEIADSRLGSIERRINGASYALGYFFTYDSNSSLSEIAPFREYQQNLLLDISYNYKARNDIRYLLQWSPSYATYTNGQFDYLTLSYTGAVSLFPGDYSLTGTVTHRSWNGLMNGRRAGRSDNISFDGGRRVNQETAARLRLAYTNLDLPDESVFDADIYSLSVFLDRQLKDKTILSGGYTLTDNRNINGIGRDYAYLSHALTITADRPLIGGLTGNIQYALTYYGYTNADSITNFTTKRRNILQAVRASLSYPLQERLTFSASVAWQLNNSNLGVRTILSSQDIQQGLQNSSLGDYQRATMTAGVRYRFQ